MIGTGEKALTSTLSALLRKRPVLLRADFVLTKDPPPLYCKTPPCLVYHKIALRKAILGPSKSALSNTGRSLSKKLQVWGYWPLSPLPTKGPKIEKFQSRLKFQS